METFDGKGNDMLRALNAAFQRIEFPADCQVHGILGNPKNLKALSLLKQCDVDVDGEAVYLWGAKATASNDVPGGEMHISSMEVSRSYIDNLDKRILAGGFNPNPGCKCGGHCGIRKEDRTRHLYGGAFVPKPGDSKMGNIVIRLTNFNCTSPKIEEHAEKQP